MPRTKDCRFIDRCIGTFSDIWGDDELDQRDGLIQFPQSSDGPVAENRRWNNARSHHLLNDRIGGIELKWQRKYIRIARILCQLALGSTSIELRHGVYHVDHCVPIGIEPTGSLGRFEPSLEVDNKVGTISHVEQKRFALLWGRPKPTVFTDSQEFQRVLFENLLRNSRRLDRSIRATRGMQP